MNNPAAAHLSPNQQALLKIRELKSQLEQLKSQRGKDAFGGEIAIVSMACRFPKTSTTPERFWQSLMEGADEVSDIPESRWDRDAFHDDNPETPGKMYATRGVFLEDIDEMDPEFFGISPREATWVDPQQRLLLETGYEALQRAGWSAERIAETTGVFVGWMHNDYQNEASDSFLNLNPYIATGAAGSFLCGRLAYWLGLQGPSIAIDTACSSSLVAVHLACQSLQRGDCDQALVGGVNTILSPTTNILTCKLKALSPTGQSRAFDAAADGYLRGEGCGVITLKRLDDARRDGDPVLGVIRGTAVGHNGFSSGLTAPNPKAQEKVIREALRRAGVSPGEVDYLEAHGTGTELGDPIEMQAAAAALSGGHDKDHPLYVGSVKTNIGHLEAAAGMAGIIKVLLAMQHQTIPPQLNFETPNPHIAWDSIPIEVVTKPVQWPDDAQRIAGVSAFGMSGTNAHMVIESPRKSHSPTRDAAGGSGDNKDAQPTPSPVEGVPHLITVSGRTESSVREIARSHWQWMQSNRDVAVADIAFTASARRDHLGFRGAVVAIDHDQAIARLKDLERADAFSNGDGYFLGGKTAPPKTAWQFTGQGSQYVGMGRQLYQTQKVFAEAIDQCDAWLKPQRSRSLLEVLFEDNDSESNGLIGQTQWTQPAIFAVQMGIAKLLQSWGMQPDVVLGHSVGQYAAACVAGVMPWQDGLTLISHRGRLIGELPEGGRMLAVFANMETVDEVIGRHRSLSLAADNATHVVISGDEAAIAEAEAEFQQRQVRTKTLQTSHAFHSDLMNPVLEPFAAIADEITFSPPQIPLICNVTGKLMAAGTVTDGAYWANHIRAAVQYRQSAMSAREMGCNVLLEIGPHAVLTQMAAAVWNGGEGNLISPIATMNRKQDDNHAISAAVGRLYTAGVNPDFTSMFAGESRHTVVLPTYPFERRRFWGPDKPRAAHAEHHTAHPLLGSAVKLAAAGAERRFESFVESDSPSWIGDHEVMGQAVLPGAAYVEMAVAAGQTAAIDPVEIRDIAFEQPLSPQQRTAMQTVVRTSGEGAEKNRTIETYSAAGDIWIRHFKAVLPVATELQRPALMDVESIATDLQKQVDASDFYAAMAEMGLNYGPAFQAVQSISVGESGVLAKISAQGDVRGYRLPPPVLDAAIHCLAAGLMDDVDDSLFLPVGIDAVQVFDSIDGDVWCHATWVGREGDNRSANLSICDGQGQVLVQMDGLKVRRIDRAAMRKMSGSGVERLMFETVWQPFRLPAAATKQRNWLMVGAGDEGIFENAAALLGEAGHQVQQFSIAGEETWSQFFDRLSTDDTPYVLDGIAWNVTANASEHSDVQSTMATTGQHVESMLALIGELNDRKVARLECGLQIVTQNAVAVVDEASPQHSNARVDPHQAKFLGLGRVLGAESPMLRCRLVDLEGAEKDDAALFDFLVTETQESQFAVRDGEFHVPRLRSAKAAKQSVASKVGSAIEPGNDSAWLITGGLGKLGRQAGKWLLDRGAGQVVLVSRRQPDEEMLELLDAMNGSADSEAASSPPTPRAIAVCADISDRQSVEDLVARFGDDLLPLQGVVHAAGVVDDGRIDDQDWSRFEKVLTPKIVGATLLDEATRALPLTHFILYSSAASVLGSPGQSNYAMGNAFLDGLAWHRRSEGLPATSINWGPWTEGMADDPRILKRMKLQGITPLEVDDAHGVLAEMADTDAAQMTVLDVDWRRMQTGLGRDAPGLLEGLMRSQKRSGGGNSEFVLKLKTLDGPKRKAHIKATVGELLREILATDDMPETGRPFIEMGLDSLMAVEFGTRLQQLLGDQFSIQPTMLFDHPTIDAISAHVDELVEEASGQSDDGSAAASAKGSEGKAGSVRTEVDDVAIVGMSCRFPGAENLEQFWQNLIDGVDSVVDIPENRWDVDRFYDPDGGPGKMATRQGGFLDDMGQFDAAFFGMSSDEACWVDPQHRMLLEQSYRAMEHAGIPTSPLADNRVGVFMGIMGQDYAFLPRLDDPEIVEAFAGAGLSHSAGVGRISYWFGFEGPSVAVDTASSSSLVALYQAVRSLQEGGCNMALAGGVNAILAPVNSLLMSRAGLLSPTGRCKSFSADADGFGRGEGCGVVVLKRLKDAVADGDEIFAVVRGAAVSHNGAGGGITAPSGKAQSRVIADAISDAGIAPVEVQYLEAHGTGTQFGDPMEIAAANAVYGKGRSMDDPLLVGSVKANISHLEAAGGVSGLIKAALSMHRGVIPPQIHFDEPSPHVPWERMPVRMVTQATPWPEVETRYAGVTAIGLVGTNAHVVLSSLPKDSGDSVPDETPTSVAEANQDRAELLLVSGNDAQSLQQTADSIADLLESSEGISLADVAWSAATGRRHFGHRLSVVASSREAAVTQLRSVSSSTKEEAASNQSNPTVAYFFGGYALTARQTMVDLCRHQPFFRATIEGFDQHLRTFFASAEFADVAGENPAEETPFTLLTPDERSTSGLVLYALHAAMAKLLEHWGVEPDAVGGVGVGQYAAAASAGSICFIDALSLVAMAQFMMGRQNDEDSDLPADTASWLDRFEQLADTMNFYPPNRSLVCSLDEREIPVYQSPGGSYWRRHAESMMDGQPANSAETVEGLQANRIVAIAADVDGERSHVIPFGTGEIDAHRSLLHLAGELYRAGCPLELKKLFAGRQGCRVTLPGHPFHKQRYWITELSDHTG